MNKAVQFVRWVIYDIFLLSFLGLFTLTILEVIFSGLVSDYVNMNLLLIVNILSAIIIVFFPNGAAANQSLGVYKGFRAVLLWLLLLSLAGGGAYAVWVYAQPLGTMTYVLAILTFLGILLATIGLNDN